MKENKYIKKAVDEANLWFSVQQEVQRVGRDDRRTEYRNFLTWTVLRDSLLSVILA